MTMLSNRIEEYKFINQGVTRIPGVNDSEELLITDVSVNNFNVNGTLLQNSIVRVFRNKNVSFSLSINY